MSQSSIPWRMKVATSAMASRGVSRWSRVIVESFHHAGEAFLLTYLPLVRPCVNRLLFHLRPALSLGQTALTPRLIGTVTTPRRCTWAPRWTARSAAGFPGFGGAGLGHRDGLRTSPTRPRRFWKVIRLTLTSATAPVLVDVAWIALVHGRMTEWR